jgi:hypothetical protein
MSFKLRSLGIVVTTGKHMERKKMKSSNSNAGRLLLGSLFALACFGVGYLAPHPRVAIAQTPNPTPSLDNVPGGIGGHGHALITNAAAMQVSGTRAGWPCATHQKCTMDFQFRMTAANSSTPTPFSCKGQHKNCLSFTGQDFMIQDQDRTGTHPSAGTYEDVNIAGRIQLFK